MDQHGQIVYHHQIYLGRDSYSGDCPAGDLGVHGWTADRYKIFYGVTEDASLICPEWSEAHACHFRRVRAGEEG